MEIVLHIGMGKTGTSSIQEALISNASLLREQGVDYLGMWFNLIDNSYDGIAGQASFYDTPADEMRNRALLFLAALEDRQSQFGTQRFVISNEEFYGQVLGLTPFIEELSKHASIKLIVYMRDPNEWLPSAYNQWGVVHKNYTGPIRPYAEMARYLVQAYSAIQIWKRNFPDVLNVRRYDASMDVVSDFFGILGLTMNPPEKRLLTRPDVSEAVLRAIYNNRKYEETLPSVFDEAFKDINFENTLAIEGAITKFFSFDETSIVIDEARPLFEYLRTDCGVDLEGSPNSPAENVDVASLRERLFEHVLQIVMGQADRIKELERSVQALESGRTAK